MKITLRGYLGIQATLFLGIFNTRRSSDMISYKGNYYSEEASVVIPLTDMLKQVVDTIEETSELYQILFGVVSSFSGPPLHAFEQALVKAWVQRCSKDFFKYTVRSMHVLVKFSNSESYTCVMSTKDLEESSDTESEEVLSRS